MIDETPLHALEAELQEGMGLPKCRKCGCMRETLESLGTSLRAVQTEEASTLLERVRLWQAQLEPANYSCLGCDHCYPAVVANVFSLAFPQVAPIPTLGCNFEVIEQNWPPVPGEYHVLGIGPRYPVAVSTLGSIELAEELAAVEPPAVSVVGKTETENIGIDKVVKNIITNPSIRFLILTGKETLGHRSGETLLALWNSGVDNSMRVIGSTGKHPVLRNVTKEELELFRSQVQVVDMIGSEDIPAIIATAGQLSQSSAPT